MQLNQELHRIETAYQEIMAQGGQNSEAGQQIAKKMDTGTMQKNFNMRHTSWINKWQTISRFIVLYGFK